MKKWPNGQEASQSLCDVNRPAMVENHQDRDENHWNVHWKTVSQVEIKQCIM